MLKSSIKYGCRRNFNNTHRHYQSTLMLSSYLSHYTSTIDTLATVLITLSVSFPTHERLNFFNKISTTILPVFSNRSTETPIRLVSFLSLAMLNVLLSNIYTIVSPLVKYFRFTKQFFTAIFRLHLVPPMITSSNAFPSPRINSPK